MYDGRLLTGYRSDKGVGRMEKREIGELEPYLEKRNGFSWLPQQDTDYYASEAVHNNLKLTQQERDVMNIPDYLLWSIGNFFLFFVFGIICIILSVRVREHKRTLDYEQTLKISKRALVLNIFSTIAGIAFVVTMLALLISKSSSSF
ncbi:unnamed protein product [Rotaria magnacalcarata]|uniref:Uncharacterized protein n=1 Tax=Rotaria magnacalcarata TaxID=392030 RepID=A0A819C2K2_9BILA|nr:unnamed protein product [Rotaria magnacalcarata]CAF2195653.1 unnamed protein product [Rotaria magnacalcarata]CAF3813607.1 unnamed protein product [Rotaria magnacalcarata]CAF3931360.1 unnamed protein product [Rotaria magnacalcarata]